MAYRRLSPIHLRLATCEILRQIQPRVFEIHAHEIIFCLRCRVVSVKPYDDL